jgi:hypothetical protein
MTQPPDHIHHVDLCERCGGLVATQLDKIPDGFTGGHITTEDGDIDLTGATLYIGAAAEPCDKETQ